MGDWLTVSWDDDGDDESVDTEDTSHDNWDNRFEDELWLEHGDTTDSDSRFSSSIGSSEVSEHQGANDSHASEEEGLVWISVDYKFKSKVSKLGVSGLSVTTYARLHE